MIKKINQEFSLKLLGIALSAAFITSLAGCASPNAANQIKSFSDATILTVSNTTEAFQLVEDNHYREEVSGEVLNYDKKTGFNPNDIKPFIGPDALQVRIAVLDGLKSYAANLSTLLGNSSLTNLDQSTTSLAQSLTNVDSSLVKDSFFKTAPVSTQDIQIFTTAINALGHWLITYQQQKDAKQVIDSMQGTVTNICQLLQKDLKILQQQVDNDNNQTLINKNQYILNNLASFDNNPESKCMEIDDLATLTQEIKNDDTLFVSIEDSVAKLQSTHTALEGVFSNNTTNITELITDFSTEAQRISKYYSSLKSTK